MQKGFCANCWPQSRHVTPRASTAYQGVSLKLRGSKLKAFFVAVAFLASIVPSAAEELASSQTVLRVGETPTSRIYRIRWTRAFARAQDRNSEITNTNPTSEKLFNFTLDGTGADSKSIVDKVRKIVARAEAQLLPALDHPYVVNRRLRIRCKTQYLVATKHHSDGVPGLMQTALSESEPVVLKSKKTCMVRYRVTRTVISQSDRQQDFEFTLRELKEAMERLRPASIEE